MRPTRATAAAQRVGIISAQKQRVELGEPFLQLNKTRAVLSRLDLGDERSGLATERIQIDVVSAAAEPAGAGQGVTFGVNVDALVEINDLTFRAISLLTMPGAAHCAASSSDSAQLAALIASWTCSTGRAVVGPFDARSAVGDRYPGGRERLAQRALDGAGGFTVGLIFGRHDNFSYRPDGAGPERPTPGARA